MFELRFFEIYRSSEYVNLLFDGILISTGLTITAGIAGFFFAFLLAALRYWNVVIFGFLSACYIDFYKKYTFDSSIVFCYFWITSSFGLCLAILVSCSISPNYKFFWIFC